VSATIRGTSAAAAELLDGTLDPGLGYPESARPTLTVALKTTPPTLFNVAAKGLAEQLALGAAFLLGDSLGLTDQFRGERQREDSCGAHRLAPVNT